jgi:regulator of protease activity HflC (stomatin/prohibitin superfamily)
MITILLLGLTLLWTIIAVLKEKGKPKPSYMHAIIILLVGAGIALIQPFKIERVDAGHVGIKVNLAGDNRGVGKYEYKTGWVIINKWINKLYEFPTFQQSIEYPEQSVITKGGLSASIHPKFNYSLKAGDIGDMFSNLRIPVKDIEQGWLQNAIVGAVNDVANKWTIDDIFNNREQFEADIIKESNKRVSKWFIISQLRTNIIPPQSLQINIQEKTNAIQKVQIAENNKLVAIAQGLERMAKAQADSATAVITASGEARAIKIKQLSLTQEYIDYLKVQKWNGVSPTMVTSDKSGFIISPGKTN